MTGSRSQDATSVRLGVASGDGRLARNGAALLYVPACSDRVPADDIDAVLTAFVDRTPDTTDETLDTAGRAGEATTVPIPYASIDWSALATPGPWGEHAIVRVVVSGDVIVTLDEVGRTVEGRAGGVASEIVALGGLRRCTFSISGDGPGSERPAPVTDLVAGIVPAGGAVLELSAAHASGVAPRAWREWFDSPVEVAPPSFDEVTEGDHTLSADDGVSWPDESDVPDDPHDPSDSTVQRRSAVPVRASDVAARLPDGTSVPIVEPIVVGRDPDLGAARTGAGAQLVPIDAPSTVSRTHVVIAARPRTAPTGRDAEPADVDVIDCDSRGRTAIVRHDDPEPVALVAWEPAPARIGDRILLGGPTAVTITRGVQRRLTPRDDDTLLPDDG